MLLVANFAIMIQNDARNLENDRNPGTWVLIEGTQRELSNEYQHNKILMVFQ